MKKCIVVLYLIVTLCFVGCDSFNYYKGDNEGPRYDLLTVAIHSIIGAEGYTWHDDAPTIEVLELDEYNRTLFRYTDSWAVSKYSLVISQKTEGNEVYYYSDANFITSEDGDFDEKDIEQLKQDNDWNKELDDSKMISKKIEKQKGALDIDYNKVELSVKECCSQISIDVSTLNFFTSDDYGRTMYYVTPEERIDDIYIVILSVDLTYNENSIMKIEDKNNYLKELKDFKDLNGWNRPT